MLKAIVLVDKNWGIGYQNHLLVSIPADTRFFQKMTLGKTVVMGHHTLLGLPGGGPLPGRRNIVLSHMPELTVRGAEVVHSTDELLELLGGNTDDVFVAGGGEVYRQLLPLCDTAYVTFVDMEYTADCQFPDLDQMPDWTMTEESEEQTCFDMEYTFRTYKKIKGGAQ